jgi:asparagine synthase (glutamine-hydrolysing)
VQDVTTLAWAAPPLVRDATEQLTKRIHASSAISSSDLEPARRAMLADRLERLPNAMLAKVDIASMSAGLEVRVPMLDDALVRHADQLPLERLMSWRWGKQVLRRLVARTPAGRIAWDKKRGFTLPLDRWLKSESIGPRMAELFGDLGERLFELTGERVTEQWQSFLHGTSRFSPGTAAMQLLWFANVALWADRFGLRTAHDREAPSAAVV